MIYFTVIQLHKNCNVVGLKVLTNSLLASLPALGNVAILLAFSYLVFAILGMELWRGDFHHRCRITPFPVQLDFNASNAPYPDAYPPNDSYIQAVTANPDLYRCKNPSGQSYEINDIWYLPANCFWPLDPNEATPMLCGMSSGRLCQNNLTCGSNYDTYGHERFSNIIFNGSLIFSVTNEPDFNSNLNYGFTNFDNVYYAFVIILQTVTASGWMVLTQTVGYIVVDVISCE